MHTQTDRNRQAFWIKEKKIQTEIDAVSIEKREDDY